MLELALFGTNEEVDTNPLIWPYGFVQANRSPGWDVNASG
jgi:hypothetical protein